MRSEHWRGVVPWLLLASASACRTTLNADPFVVPAEAGVAYETALAKRENAHKLGVGERKDEFEQALAAAKLAQASAPDEFRLAVLVQDLEFELDPAAASAFYAAAPQETAAQKTLAARALLPDRKGDARELLLKACEQDPSFAWARYGLATIERVQGQPDEALKNGERALALDSTLIEALRLLVDLYEQGGKREQALAARKALVKVTGNDLEERHQYALLLLDSDDAHDAEDAETQLRAILTALGDPPPESRRELVRDLKVDLGTSYSRRGRADEAIASWREALALDPDCLTALDNIGVELDHRGDARGALAAFEEYLARAQEPNVALPEDQVLRRYLDVPNHILELKKKLGIATEPAADDEGSTSQ